MKSAAATVCNKDVNISNRGGGFSLCCSRSRQLLVGSCLQRDDLQEPA